MWEGCLYSTFPWRKSLSLHSHKGGTDPGQGPKAASDRRPRVVSTGSRTPVCWAEAVCTPLSSYVNEAVALWQGPRALASAVLGVSWAPLGTEPETGTRDGAVPARRSSTYLPSPRSAHGAAPMSCHAGWSGA